MSRARRNVACVLAVATAAVLMHMTDQPTATQLREIRAHTTTTTTVIEIGEATSVTLPHTT